MTMKAQNMSKPIWLDRNGAIRVPARIQQIGLTHLDVNPIAAYKRIGFDVKVTESPDWLLVTNNDVTVQKTPFGWQYCRQGYRQIDAQMDGFDQCSPIAYSDNPLLRRRIYGFFEEEANDSF